MDMVSIVTTIANAVLKLPWQWIRRHWSPNAELKRENADLKAQLSQQRAFEVLKHEMTYSKDDDGVYWKKDGSGPYCPTCLHADHRDILLAPSATSDVYSCPIHGTTYCMHRYRVRAANHAPTAPRSRSWPRLRAELERLHRK
jgi:hypothetical protein